MIQNKFVNAIQITDCIIVRYNMEAIRALCALLPPCIMNNRGGSMLIMSLAPNIQGMLCRLNAEGEPAREKSRKHNSIK